MGKTEFKTAILDYGMGNIFSVKKACDYVGLNNILTDSKSEAETADALILPGVGAFGDAMDNLSKLGLDKVVENFAAAGKPVMGVCLGMQLLLDESEEFGKQKGLGIISGSCVRFPEITDSGEQNRIPQIAWNKIYSPIGVFSKDTPLEYIANNEYMYFVHSYHVKVANVENILSLTNYNGLEYCSSLRKDRIFAFQFHPEKSGEAGLAIYRNFKNLIEL